MIRSLCLALLIVITTGLSALAEDTDPLAALPARQLYLDLPREPALGRAALDWAVADGHSPATADLVRLPCEGGVLPKDLPRSRTLFLIAALGIGAAARAYAVMLGKGATTR